MQARATSWRRSVAPALLAGGLALGCGANAGDTGADGKHAAESFEVCPAPLGNPEDLAATPRADENLELLALAVEPDAVVVSQANYERVVADVAAIRALVPELAQVQYRPPHDGRSLRVTFDDAGLNALMMNAFGAWDCLNEVFGATVVSTVMDNFDLIPYAPSLRLRGIHDMPRVARLYQQLPGIDHPEIYGLQVEGATWCIGRNGADYEYVVDAATGSCSFECQEHEAHHFSSESAGEATPLEVWRSAGGEPLPAWYARLCL